MARLPYLDKEDLTPENRDLLERPINLNRILVHSPDVRRAAAPMSKYIRFDSKGDPRLREARHHAGRLPRAGALRVVAPHQDRP